MKDKPTTMKTILKEWLTPTLLAGLIATLLISYGGFKEYVKTVTFSDAEIKALTEKFVKDNMGISARANIEALNEMTYKYNQLTKAIDTLDRIYRTAYDNINNHMATDQAILKLVHNADSLSVERLAMLKELVKENKIQSNATQLNLDRTSTVIKVMEKFNPHTNYNGD